MKKLFSILVIAFLIITNCSAQQTATTATLTTLDSGLVSGWVVNTGSKTLYTQVSNAWDAVSIQLVETKVSGTVAGSTVLVGSNDGVNFVTISRPSIAASTLRLAYSDTLTSTDQTTNTKLWVISSSAGQDGQTVSSFPYKYIGVKKTGSGTMKSTVKAYAIFKHK